MEMGLKIDSRQQLENLTINGKPIWEGRYDKKQWLSEQSEFRNLIALPLRIKGQCLGVIKVENKHKQHGDKFSEDDRLYFETIANVVALAIESAKLAQQKTTGATRVLSTITSALVGQFDMDRLLTQVVKSTMKTLHAEVCSIFLRVREGDKDILVMRAGSGFAEKLVGIAKYDVGQAFTGHIATMEMGLKIDSRQQLENLTINGKRIWEGRHDVTQWPSRQSEFRNLIALPLRIKGQCLGVIKVENKHKQYGDKFSEDDRLYFETIANVVALVIENAKLHEQTENQRKAIAAKAAHRIHNQATNYDDMELALEVAIDKIASRHRVSFENILESLRETTKNLKRMTEEFKNYGKPLQLVKTMADINQIVEKEVKQARVSKEIEIKIDILMTLDSNLPKVSIDVPRFAEATKELLRNSKKAISKNTGVPYGKIWVTTRLITNKKIGPGCRLPE
jgi:GAF domain-containing protein